MVDLVEELSALLQRLEAKGVDYALCGGLAMAVYAFPRATVDIDLMIEPESLPALKSIAQELGFEFDVGLMTFQSGAVRIHRFTKLPRGEAQALVLDLLLVTRELRKVWEDRRRLPWERGELSVVSKQGLIALKSLRRSGQDEDDIRRLKEDSHEG